MINGRHLKKTEFMQKDLDVEYQPLVIAMPSILAKNEHIIGSVDQSFSDGCRALIKKKFVKAY